DLASNALGSKILSFSDEWFADASNLLVPAAPIRRPGVFVHSGAWYDGWETRRHNSKLPTSNPTPSQLESEAADWVIVKLGVSSGRIRGVAIDTAFFDGNHAPEIAVLGTFSDDDDKIKADGYEGWETVLGKYECGPNRKQAWDLGELTKAYTHIKLLMYPDGGIARLRLYGLAVPVFPEAVDTVFELSAIGNGGRALSCSDQHFGTKDKILLPGRGKDMGDGWETKRTRGEHVDWVVIQLGTPGEIEKIMIDTANFRGNFPKEVQVFGTLRAGDAPAPGGTEEGVWTEVLSPQRAGPDKEHDYTKDILKNVDGKSYSHVKLVIIPDGGISRIRVWGKRTVLSLNTNLRIQSQTSLHRRPPLRQLHPTTHPSSPARRHRQPAKPLGSPRRRMRLGRYQRPQRSRSRALGRVWAHSQEYWATGWGLPYLFNEVGAFGGEV
ncbi:Allantoicase, partial [Microthyrium microscopicum]